MTNPKVSVVVPVYNVEKYLKECLDSILAQTLKEIEIICINDGSTDSSGKILDEYAKKDSRIVVIHKKNSGYGHTMNIGLDRAKGDYIGIVESDDFIEENMFETLYYHIKKDDLDIVRCNYYHYNSSKGQNILNDNNFLPLNKILNPLEDKIVFYQAPAIWVNLVKRSLIKDNQIRFLHTPGASFQDTSFAFKLYSVAKRIKIIDDAMLHYRIDNQGSSVRSLGKVFCVNDEYAEILRFTKEKNIYDDLRYVIPKIKFACYRWNHNRVAIRYRILFISRYWVEMLKDFISGNIKKDLYTKSEYRKLRRILFFPFWYFIKDI